MAAKHDMDEGTKSTADSQKEALQNRIKKCIQLISTYSWLIDAFLAEFFVENHWSGFPPSWQKCFQELTMDEFSDLILPGSSCKAFRIVLPLSLQAFISTCHYLSLPRKQKIEDPKDTIFSRSEQLPHSFRRHVKLKKQHEIIHLSQVIKKVTDSVHCRQIVDVGGGLGHLSRYLALVHNLDVTTIEAEGHHKIIAEKFDKEALEDLHKQSKKIENTALDNSVSIPPIHLTKTIPLEIRPQEFVKVLIAAKGNQIKTDSLKMGARMQPRLETEDKTIVEADSFVIIGLHTCGDLASTLIRTFANCPDVRGIVIVGCCYMKLTHTQFGSDLRENESTSNTNMIGIETERKCYEDEKACGSRIAETWSVSFEQEEKATSQYVDGKDCSEDSSQELSRISELKETASSHHEDELNCSVNVSLENTRCFDMNAKAVSYGVDGKICPANANQEKTRCLELDVNAISYNVDGKLCPVNANQEKVQICHEISKSLAANEATQKSTDGQFCSHQNITETKAVTPTSPISEINCHGGFRERIFDNEVIRASSCSEDAVLLESTSNSADLIAISEKDPLLLGKLCATQSDVMKQNAISRNETNFEISKCSDDDVRSRLTKYCESMRCFDSQGDSVLKNTESLSNRNPIKISRIDSTTLSDNLSVFETCSTRTCSASGDLNDCTYVPSLKDSTSQDATLHIHKEVSENKPSGLASPNQPVVDFPETALPENNSCQDETAFSISLNGYPMSIYLQNQPCQPLGWDAFELACHNLDNYCQRLKDDKERLKLQCYRAVLEVVIRKVRPDMRNPQIRCQRIKGAYKMSFKEYADVALSRINIRKQSEETLNDLNTGDLLGRWKDVIMFYCLRLLLGPVIETLVLLDRLLYLQECGFQSELIPVFDAKVSPRNFVLLAKKQESPQSLN